MDIRDSVQLVHVRQSVAANQMWNLDDCERAPAKEME